MDNVFCVVDSRESKLKNILTTVPEMIEGVHAKNKYTQHFLTFLY